ncbi:MAG TPA: hypothetical protein VKE22_30135 [Haliangiales bacterium]|nr:hypothetical protein [Haliangiales bacterium]
MAKLMQWLLLAGLLIPSSACVISRPPQQRETVVVSERSCRPSQYWDGSRCRHKGKGEGARKHDDD